MMTGNKSNSGCNPKERRDHCAAKPQPKVLNHGFHGSETEWDRTTLIRAIRAIRGKIFAGMRDSDGLQGRDRLPFFAFIAFFVAMSCLPASAQIQQAWVAKYNNGIPNGAHQAVKMLLDTDGNIYIIGFSKNTNGNLGYATIKYAPNGNQVWAARFDSTNIAPAKPARLVLDSNGNVIVTGSAVTVKYDTSGNQLWTAPYAGAWLAVDGSGNSYVTGFGTNFDTVKLSPGGSNVWLKTVVSPYGPNVGQAVAATPGGDVYVCGSYTYEYIASGLGAGYYDALMVVKYDPSGNAFWSDQYKPGYYQAVADLALDAAENLYLCFNGTIYDNYTTFKYNSDGSSGWSAYDPTDDVYSYVHGLALDSSDNVFVTGQNAYYYPESSYGTYKIITNGSFVSTNTYPSVPTSTNVGTAVTVDRWNNVYVTGYSQGTNAAFDIVTIKYDNDGNQIWLQRYNGPGNGDDEGNAIAVDASGNVYVTGFETVAGGGTEMVTVKYAPGPLLKKQANGDFLLQAQGSPGQTFGFQASTNLQTWQDLGATNADTNGNVQFLDTNAPFFSHRFYLATPQ